MAHMTKNSENPFVISTSPDSDLAGSCQIDLNDSGTCAESDAPLTQDCSGFGLENASRDLIEQIQNYRNETDKDARTHLAGNIGRTVTDIRQLMQQGE